MNDVKGIKWDQEKVTGFIGGTHYCHLSMQADSIEAWEESVSVAHLAGGASEAVEFHIKIGNFEWKGSMRELIQLLKASHD